MSHSIERIERIERAQVDAAAAVKNAAYDKLSAAKKTFDVADAVLGGASDDAYDILDAAKAEYEEACEKHITLLVGWRLQNGMDAEGEDIDPTGAYGLTQKQAEEYAPESIKAYLRK